MTSESLRIVLLSWAHVAVANAIYRKDADKREGGAELSPYLLPAMG